MENLKGTKISKGKVNLKVEMEIPESSVHSILTYVALPRAGSVLLNNSNKLLMHYMLYFESLIKMAGPS